eukprot:gene16638-22072_t
MILTNHWNFSLVRYRLLRMCDGLQPLEVRERFGTEKVDQLRCRLDHVLHCRILGVENAQRVAVQAALAIFVELVSVLLEVRDEFGAVQRAFG